MKLQLALDTVTVPEAIDMLKELEGLIDIVEVGTPIIIHEGVHAVRAIRKEFPQIKILADLKIMDAGDYEAKAALDAGADIVTVMGAAYDETIAAAVKTAHAVGAKVMVDMMNSYDLARRAKEIEALGADYICVHTAFDIQGEGHDPIEELRIVSENVTPGKAAVAGGVGLKTIAQVVAQKPAVVIVGGSITNAADKRSTAARIKAEMEG